jgi:hypothetical protein
MSQRFTGGAYRQGGSYDLASTGAQTLCGWVYLNSTSGTAVVMYLSANSANNDDSILLWYDGTQFSAWCRKDGEGPYYTASGAPSTGTWYHVAMTCSSSGDFKTYLNGDVYSQASAPNLAGRPNLDYHHLGFGGDAIMQDCMVFADALSQTEIRHVQTTLTAPTRIAPYAWYRLRNDSPLADATGNGHTLAGGSGSISNGANILMAAASSVVTSGAISAGASYSATASGSSLVSGSAVEAASKAVTALGSAVVSGAVAQSATKPLVAAGTSLVGGEVGISLPIAATASVVTSGAIALGSSRAVDAAGNAVTSGAAALSAAIPVSLVGSSRVSGRVSFVNAHRQGPSTRGHFSRRSATVTTGRRAVRR